MPTLMQKIRLAFKGWNRRRDEARVEAQKDFVTRNVGGGAPGAPGHAADKPSGQTLASDRAPDMDGLIVAFLDDSGVIAYYLDCEVGEVLDVRDGSALDARGAASPPRAPPHRGGRGRRPRRVHRLPRPWRSSREIDARCRVRGGVPPRPGERPFAGTCLV